MKAPMTRIADHARGFSIGVCLTLACGVWLYMATHTVKFTSTSTNEASEIVDARKDSVSIAKLMPPAEKPKVK